MDLQAFIAKWTGQIIPFTNVPAGSCMAVHHRYLAEVFGLTDPTLLAASTAAQVFTNFANINGSQYFTLVANTPTGFPHPGDILIFAPDNPVTQTGKAGHIVVVVTSDVLKGTFFEQDYPYGSTAHVREYAYQPDGRDVLGWLTPKPQGHFISDAEQLVIDQKVQEAMAFEELQKFGYSTITDVDTKLKSYTDQIALLKTQVGDLTANNQALELEVKHTKDQMAKLADITQQQAASDSSAIDQGLNAAEALKNITVDMNVVASDLGTTYPPVKNITGAIQNLQNQLKAAQIQLTKQAQLNKAKAQQTTQAVQTVSKGFFSWLRGLHGQIWE